MSIPQKIYKRKLIHNTYGGQRQGGISTPKDYPMIMIFTGDYGEEFGYKDGWNKEGYRSMLKILVRF